MIHTIAYNIIIHKTLISNTSSYLSEMLPSSDIKPPKILYKTTCWNCRRFDFQWRYKIAFRLQVSNLLSPLFKFKRPIIKPLNKEFKDIVFTIYYKLGCVPNPLRPAVSTTWHSYGLNSSSSAFGLNVK